MFDVDRMHQDFPHFANLDALATELLLASTPYFPKHTCERMEASSIASFKVAIICKHSQYDWPHDGHASAHLG